MLLAKYKEIEDIVVFGSFAKGKFEPKDIDTAIISEEKSLSFIGKISSEMPEKVHIEVLSHRQIYRTRLGLAIISEGFSVKENKFLRDMMGVKPKKMYSYELKGLKPSEKRQFNRALNSHLIGIKGERLGSGVVMVPVDKAGFFDDFLERWNLKFTSKAYNVW